MSYEGIENAISDKSRAIVITHLFGYPMDVQRMNQLVRNAEQKFVNKIYIIPDAAHSFGARYNEELVTKFGDAAFFGLNASKIITSRFGGMVTTNDRQTYQKLLS